MAYGKLVPFTSKVTYFAHKGYVYYPEYTYDKDAVRWLYSNGYHPMSLQDFNLSHLTPVTPAVREGEFILVPGIMNFLGIGVYFANPGISGRGGNSSSSQQAVDIRIHRAQAEDAGVVFDDNGWPKSRNGLRLLVVERVEVGTYVPDIWYCLVVGNIDVLTTDGARSVAFGLDKVSFKANEHQIEVVTGNVTNRVLKNSKVAMSAAECPTVFHRLLGLLIALCCVFVAALKAWRNDKTWAKWAALGLFLSALGGKWKIPSSIANEWDTGVTKNLGGGKMFIRPRADSSLFWIVGGMTVQKTVMPDGSSLIEGEDVYDFHPQLGQRTLVNNDFQSHCWAWSGGEDDPTQIPTTPVVSRVVGWLDPTGRHVRAIDGVYMFSNNFWNWVGGKPFTSVLRVKE